MRRSKTFFSRAAALLSLACVVPWGSAASAQTPAPGPLFPEPFRVAHRLIQDDGDGTRFEGEPVVDTYGGSWIVSQRPDGARLIVDLARRELTEVRQDKGTYWTLSFDRFAELQAELRRARGATAKAAISTGEKQAGANRTGASAQPAPPPFELVVSEEPPAGLKGARSGGGLSGDAPAGRAGVRHLKVARKGAPATEGAFEVWVDPSIRMTPAAIAALSALESEALAAPPAPETAPPDSSVAKAAGEPQDAEPITAGMAPGRYLAAARLQGAGALPVRSVRPAAVKDGIRIGSVEDIATKVERLERFPNDLVEIPEGMRRTPHPLEAVVRFLDEEAERNAALAGVKGKG